MQTLLEQILVENGSAYLNVDSSFCIQLVGGHTEILDAVPFMVGDSLFDVLPELVGTEAVLSEMLAGRTARLHLQQINRDGPDGSRRYYDLLTLPNKTASGDIDGLIQLITDVTERGMIEQVYAQQRNELRLLEKRISQQNIELARTNAELRHASRLKDEFLAGISHEVRTPLTAILGMTELLHSPEVGALNAEQSDMLHRVEESSRHLLAIINDLLDLARLDAGQFALETHLVSVRHLCDSSLRMVNQLAIRKRLNVRVQIDPQVRVILADERRLRQALINLLSNAIKFTPSGGSIGLDVHGDPDNETVQCTVWDTGIGIAAEDMPHLFQPFSQIDGVYQREQTGSGLGLVMVARLVALHGGGVTLSSEPGVGSRFTISLPWQYAEQQEGLAQPSLSEQSIPTQKALEEPQPLPHTGRDEALLLIEDDSTGAAVLVDYLQRCGYCVTHTISGDEALACIRQKPPQLVIADLHMRGMNGLETIRQIRANVATRAIPIIVLTALAMPGVREQCLEAGANLYLGKPVQLRRLVEEASALLASANPTAADS